MTYGSGMAAGYDRGRGLPAREIDKWMIAAHPYLPPAGGLVLDLGAGTGRFSDALARPRSTTVVACEPSPAMRAALRSNCPGIAVVGGTAEASPFRGGVFDAVWASQVIHHVTNLPAFAAGMRRILRPGGHLLLRGGFGPAEELPLYRYFPHAWAPGSAVRLPLDRIAAVLADVDVTMVDHRQVEQTFAETTDELMRKVATRSLSQLATLPDQAFREGLSSLRRDAAEGRITGPFVDRLDLVVFRSSDEVRT